MDLHNTIARAQAGSHDAFTALVEHYQRMAFGYAVALVGDFHAAHDVVQEAFVIAYFRLGTLHNPAAFGQWLRGIVRFQAARVLRKRHQCDLALDAAFGIASADAPLDEQVIVSEARTAVLAAIARLPQPLRSVIVLYYIDGHRQQEVAAFLGLPVSTVNNRLHAARQRLKERMLPLMNDVFATDLPDDLAANVGQIITARGPLLDVRFAPGERPALLSQLVFDKRGATAVVVAAPADPARSTVQCLVLDAHTPLQEGATVRNTGIATTTAASAAAIQQLVATLPRSPTTPQLLETGIKAIDLFCPFVRGGTVSIVGDRRVGTQVLMEELLHNLTSHTDPLALLAFAHVDDVAEIWYGYAPQASGAVQTVYVPVAETRLGTSDGALAACDAIVSHSAVLGKTLQIWPAIDPLASTSRALNAAVVGAEHMAVVQEARDLLARYPADAPLLSDARPEARRAQKIRAFCSQPLFVAAPFTGRPGQYVRREDAVAGVRVILAGAYDHLPVEAFLYVGTVAQAAERAQAA